MTEALAAGVALLRDSVQCGAQTADNRARILKLFGDLRSGAAVCKQFKRGFLHSKTYLLSGDDSKPVVLVHGSANLTWNGAVNNHEQVQISTDLDVRCCDASPCFLLPLCVRTTLSPTACVFSMALMHARARRLLRTGDRRWWGKPSGCSRSIGRALSPSRMCFLRMCSRTRGRCELSWTHPGWLTIRMCACCADVRRACVH